MGIHETYCDSPHPHPSPSYSRPCSHNLLANGHTNALASSIADNNGHHSLMDKQMDKTNSRDASFDAYCLMTLDDGYLKLVSQMNKVTALTLELHCDSKYSNTQTHTHKQYLYYYSWYQFIIFQFFYFLLFHDYHKCSPKTKSYC